MKKSLPADVTELHDKGCSGGFEYFCFYEVIVRISSLFSGASGAYDLLIVRMHPSNAIRIRQASGECERYSHTISSGVVMKQFVAAIMIAVVTLASGIRQLG